MVKGYRYENNVYLYSTWYRDTEMEIMYMYAVHGKGIQRWK
jgi:hypothetical protein